MAIFIIGIIILRSATGSRVTVTEIPAPPVFLEAILVIIQAIASYLIEVDPDFRLKVLMGQLDTRIDNPDDHLLAPGLKRPGPQGVDLIKVPLDPKKGIIRGSSFCNDLI